MIGRVSLWGYWIALGAILLFYLTIGAGFLAAQGASDVLGGLVFVFLVLLAPSSLALLSGVLSLVLRQRPGPVMRGFGIFGALWCFWVQNVLERS